MRFLSLILLGLAVPAGLEAQEALSARDSAVHALNRLAYGGMPGEADSIARTGVMPWVLAQVAADGPDPARVAAEAPFAIQYTSAKDLAALLRDARMARRARHSDSASAAPADPAARTLRQLSAELDQLTLARAVAARWQLREILADFWFNHFNVYEGKGLVRVYLPSYLEEVIRPRVFGRFDDLLEATAKSPAMLFYLDNAESVAADSERRAPPRRFRPGRVTPPREHTGSAEPRPDGVAMAAPTGADAPRSNPPAPLPRRPTGINENYGRELMELHTLGVNGGYTQADVIAVARILTGWTIARPAQGGGFRFNPRAHDEGAKVVMGVAFPPGHGQDEGERLLHLLAESPATLRHIAAELCERLVSDGDNSACEDTAVAAWARSGGDLRAVVGAIVSSPAFWAPANVGAKVKTPLEFVVSAVRAVGGAVDTTARLAAVVARLGEPLFRQPSPAGYPERQDDWVNSGALLARMNVAVALAAGKLPGVTPDLDAVSPPTADADSLLSAINDRIFGGGMTPHTRDAIRAQIADLHDPVRARAFAIGLALGSPDFQRQ